jgi:predicted nuclease of predicted toxin-antitoxin system
MSCSPPEFLLDENVRSEVKEFLEARGYRARYVPKGSTNGEVASVAREGRLVLLTHDSDFSNSVLYPPREFFGIVVIRIHPPTLDKLLPALEQLLLKVKEFKGRLFILEERGFKVLG